MNGLLCIYDVICRAYNNNNNDMYVHIMYIFISNIYIFIPIYIYIYIYIYIQYSTYFNHFIYILLFANEQQQLTI